MGSLRVHRALLSVAGRYTGFVTASRGFGVVMCVDAPPVSVFPISYSEGGNAAESTAATERFGYRWCAYVKTSDLTLAVIIASPKVRSCCSKVLRTAVTTLTRPPKWPRPAGPRSVVPERRPLTRVTTTRAVLATASLGTYLFLLLTYLGLRVRPAPK